MSDSSSRLWLYGTHACRAALENKNRTIYKIHLLGDRSHDRWVSHLNSPVPQTEIVDKQWFEKIFGSEAVHQGIALQVSPLPPFSFEDLEELDDPQQTVVLMDQIHDPHNVGAILRSAAAFGVKAAVMTSRHAPQESPILAKSASGALEKVPLIRCGNLAQAIEKLKTIGFWTYGLSESGTLPLHTISFSPKVALILGAEGKGMRQKTMDHCDFLLTLETQPDFSTLNVSNASAIALYQIFSQSYNLQNS